MLYYNGLASLALEIDDTFWLKCSLREKETTTQSPQTH